MTGPGRPRATAAKVARARAAIDALLETDVVNQSYGESPLAHETRANLYAALVAVDAVAALVRARDRR